MAQISKWPLIRIESDGLRNLRIIDLQTGEEILKGCVHSLEWKMSNDGVPTASLRLLVPAVDVAAVDVQLEVPAMVSNRG